MTVAHRYCIALNRRCSQFRSVVSGSAMTYHVTLAFDKASTRVTRLSQATVQLRCKLDFYHPLIGLSISNPAHYARGKSSQLELCACLAHRYSQVGQDSTSLVKLCQAFSFTSRLDWEALLRTALLYGEQLSSEHTRGCSTLLPSKLVRRTL
jgi:hypothetical protein